MVLVGDEHVLAFHDRDIVLQGIGWLEQKLRLSDREQFYTVREIGERLSKNAESMKSSSAERSFVPGKE
jgi:hypothetical protein